jgi:hypothetical protein
MRIYASRTVDWKTAMNSSTVTETDFMVCMALSIDAKFIEVGCQCHDRYGIRVGLSNWTTASVVWMEGIF